VRDALLAQVAASRHASALTTISLVSPWDAAVSDAEPDAVRMRPADAPRRVPSASPTGHRDAVRKQVREVAERHHAKHNTYPSARKLAEAAKVRQATASAVLAEIKAGPASAVVTTVNGHTPATS